VPAPTAGPTRLYTRPFLGIVAVNLLSFSQWFGLNPVLPLVVLELGGDAALAGLAFALFSIPSVIFRPIFGGLIDRVGTRLILLGGTLGVGLFAPAYLVPSLVLMMVIRIGHGIAWAAVMVAGPALMARLAPTSRRGEAASVYDLMPSVAQMVMSAVGLLIWTVGGGLAVFLLAAAVGIAAWLIVLATAPHDKPAAPPTGRTGRLPLLEPSAVLPMVIVILFMSSSPLFVIYPPLLATQNGIPLTELALYYPIYGLSMVGSRILVSKVIDRLPRLWVIVGGALLAIAGLFGSIQATSIVALTVAGALNAGAVGVLVPALTAAVIDLAPPGRMGSAMGTYTIGYQFAGGFGAAIWGFVIEASGFIAAYWAAIAVEVALLAVALAYRRRLERPAPSVAGP
jgi:MFS family permease